MSGLSFSWEAGLAAPGVPVYLGCDYQRLLAGHDRSEPRLLACHAGARTAYLPLLVRELGNGLKEAYSAYGYGGLWGDLVLSAEDLTALRTFLAEASIVAVFLRHAPFLANHTAFPEPLCELSRRTYAVSLQAHDSFALFQAGLPQKLRWSLNFARRAGLQVAFHPLSECPPARLQAFYRLYAELMQQKETAAYYLFSEEFFLAHARHLGARCELAEIVDEKTGRLLAGAFFLSDDTGWTHYHLSAATRELMQQQGMELLLATAIFRHGNQGRHALHLGGGHALDESDGLSRFKAKFASRRLDFHCSRLICDEAAYRAERARLPIANPGFFLVADARGF